MAHEMGHNLGMTHDDGRTCSSCAHSGGCVMSSVLQSSPLAWTQCSVDDINANNWNCLNDAPTASYEKSCGNGIKEEGEECDCGTAAECPTADPCCETTGCKLKSTSQCGDGPCCSNCQFKAKGTSCRAVATECDIAESCNGVSNLCPEDNYLADGTDCNSTTGYCYAGQCRTHESQCQYLFGSTAVKAQDACWDLVNTGGDQYGNCGKLSNGTYTVCATADILCGKLQCTIPGSSGAVLPVIGNSKTGTSVTTTFSNGTTISCNGGDADFGDDAPSPGLTADGTKCGTQKMCLSNRCRSFSEISVGVSCGQVNGQTCAGRGYCNQDNQCVCRDNYDPGSNCENTVNENALLTCYKCSDADACGGTPNSANSTTELCTSNEQICQVVRLARTGQTTHYTRGCVYKTSCTEECQTTSGDTKCVDCCQTSRCNTGNGEPTTESSGIKTTISAAYTFTLSLLVLLF
ncbi:disintegrin and metalloproteinase domain-containing protein 12-like [Lingula anatina]|uniref:Disintegrin and metalloproteinase domain-containing protein 12-like n=1 Tax=Lingula anatina TaxID=7574 RepID=A0A1S3IN75_LINAN|nr:disintegrin and metalloproteinase domain-containing protein 12-like [Lingula anatina]|eukprot:XP_013399533.1 disintegrin and metalloproteinase domain-containing protein 12-like [Lingula anatina]